MGKVAIFLSLFFFVLSLWSCESAGYLKSEISGTAKPAGGIQEVVPVKKSYPVSNKKLRFAVIELLDEQGYIYDENPSDGSIKTEPKLTADTDQNKFGIIGSKYYEKLKIKMRGSTIKFTARFNKESNLTMGGQNLEYPEKENELRKNFFMALDKKLGVKSSYQNVSYQGQSSLYNNNDIYKVQKRLTDLGYEPGPADGIMGQMTMRSIMKFQKDNDLPSTGILDNDTILKLGIQNMPK